MLGILFDGVSHVSNKGRAPEAYWATPAIRGSGVEVGACHDGLCLYHSFYLCL